MGFIFAIASAAMFALSGIFASALMGAGWSAIAAVTVRIFLSALLLLVPTIIMMRGRWGLMRRAWPQVLLFGAIAVAGCQLAFFLAVQYIPPSLALLIEFLGPVLLVAWIWARTRVSPGVITIAGALLALAGLAAVSGVGSEIALHPLSAFFALIAAVGLAIYFATGARTDHGIPPIPFVGFGLIVGAVILGLFGLTGILPLTATNEAAVIGGQPVPAWLAVAGLALIATALPYTFGVSASRNLGATMASFTGYSEPIFGILWTIALLSIVPTGMQWLGATLIIAGVITVKIGQLRR